MARRMPLVLTAADLLNLGGGHCERREKGERENEGVGGARGEGLDGYRGETKGNAVARPLSPLRPPSARAFRPVLAPASGARALCAASPLPASSPSQKAGGRASHQTLELSLFLASESPPQAEMEANRKAHSLLSSSASVCFF